MRERFLSVSISDSVTERKKAADGAVLLRFPMLLRLSSAQYILDSGSIGPAEKFVLPFVSREISEINKSASFIDHKTELQQIVQQVEGEKLRYVIVSESGPDHDKVFEVEARLNSNVIGREKPEQSARRSREPPRKLSGFSGK